MSAVRQWIGGTPALHRAVEGTMKETDPKSVISENPHRRMIQSRDSTCGELVIKEFQAPKGTRRITAALGRDPARREWQMLTRLHAAARNVPRPHATARLHDGRTWIVMECLAGRSLASVLGDCRAPRQQLMQKLGSELTRLHSEGFVHGDLHVGNWHVTPDDEPILLDFQRGRRTRSRAARIRDVGEFDFSLALEGVSLSGRLRFRIAALDLPSPLDHAAREQVRAAGRASEARGRQYFRRRTRHFKRPGRHIRPVEHEGARGLRLSSFPEPAVRASLSAHREVLSRGGSDVLKQDHRARVTRVRLDEGAVVVKEVTKMGLRRWLADRLRGSPARRAWIGGHGLQIRGIRAATPLAFVEKTRMGIPVKS
ncbi:MAG: lipopolysaccharide kinase InaA family protein, partial [Myxococcota bacterium]